MEDGIGGGWGGGGGGAVRDRHHENFNEGQVCRQKPSGLERASRNVETIRQAMPVNASRKSRTIKGGPVCHAPQPTPKPSTTSRTGQKRIDIRGAGFQERTLADVHRRSLPEESTERTTGDQTLLEGEAE